MSMTPSNNGKRPKINPGKSLKLKPICVTVLRRFVDSILEVNGCWIWQREIGRDGYGNYRFKYSPDFVSEYYYKKGLVLCVQAHRMVYEAFGNKIPKDKILRHQCHNKACCNPDHLLPGTHKENCDDDVLTGVRKTNGTGIRKLSAYQVRSLKNKIIDGQSFRSLSLQYGISITVVREYAKRLEREGYNIRQFIK